MFRSKLDIDQHVREVFRKCTTSDQRSLESLKIANLYYKIKEFNQASVFAQNYLSVKPNDAIGHEVLGKCYEGLGNNIKALEEYKMSLTLNMNNEKLLKTVYNLIIDDSIPLDLIKDKYWIERVEQLVINSPSELLKLKQKIMKLSNTATNGNINDLQYENLLKSELDIDPKSLEVHLKIIKFYSSTNRLNDAFKYGINIEQLNYFNNKSIWYEQLITICKNYETFVLNENNKSDIIEFYKHYVNFIEKNVKINIINGGKNIKELCNSLITFDEVLLKLKMYIPNIENASLLDDKLLFHHMTSQLCYYTLVIMLKKAVAETHDSETLKSKFIQSLPLLLFGLNAGVILNFESSGGTGERFPEKLVEYEHVARYRMGQCILYLNILKKYNFVHEENVQNAFRSAEWFEPIFSYVLNTTSTRTGSDSFFKSHISKMKISTESASMTVQHLLRLEHVLAVEIVHPSSLHHLVWLGVSMVLENSSTLPPSFYRVTNLPKIQFGCRNIFMTHMNLSIIDVDAFLYASVFCALSTLQFTQSTLRGPPVLLADVDEHLVSKEQSNWWNNVHEIILTNKNEHLLKYKKIVSGLELIRNVSNTSLHVAILVYLARMFASRASDLANVTSLSVTMKHKIKALESRSQHYWNCAIPSLQRLEKNQNISGVSDTFFRYHGEPITSIEATNIIEEGKCTLGCFLMNDNKYKEALTLFQTLKSAFSKFNLAKIYFKLAEDELHNNDTLTDTNVSILNYGTSKSYKYTLFLQKAKENLMFAQTRLGIEGSSNNYPGLSNKIVDLLHDIELKIEQADSNGDDDKGFNLSSSFSNHNTSMRSEYMSPVQQKHPNTFLKNGLIRPPYYSSPDTNNSNKTLETQMELLLERVKRLQDIVERNQQQALNKETSSNGITDGIYRIISTVEEKIDNMNEKIEEMHNKYLNILTDIKECVKDKTDVINDVTENLTSLTSKVNLLMGHDLDDNLFLNTDHYHDLYSGEPTPTGGGSGDVEVHQHYKGLQFPEGQSLPNFLNMPSQQSLLQQTIDPVTGLLPPTMGGIPNMNQQRPNASGAPLVFQPSMIPFFPNLMPGNPGNIFVNSGSGFFPPGPAPLQTAKITSIPSPPSTTPNNETTSFGTGGITPSGIKSSTIVEPAAPVMKNGVPHNVVITRSDKLPTVGPPIPTPQMSVVIPPQHLLVNKQKQPPTTSAPTSFIAPTPTTTAAATSTMTPSNLTASVTAQVQSIFGTNTNLPNMFSGVQTTPNGGKTGSTAGNVSFGFGTGNETGGVIKSPHSFQIQMPNQTSFIQALEKSPIIKQSLEESVQSDEEEEREEHDPMPDFKPIIPLPDEIVVTTGEESETVLFEKRAKLYRFSDSPIKEWKERGLGMLKILQNKETGKVRLLMRREIVHKICANHFLHPDMELTYKNNSAQQLVWYANDYADEVVSEEKFAAKFKKAEDAAEFKKIFDEYKLKNVESAKKDSTSKTAAPATGGFSKELFQKKAGSWECKDCYITNDETKTSCIACNAPNPTAKAQSTPPPSTNTTDSKLSFGGLTFSSTPVVKKDEPKKELNKPTAAAATTGTPTSLFSSFKFSSVPDTTNTTPTSNPFKFGIAPMSTGLNTSNTNTPPPSTDNFPTLKTLLSTPTGGPVDTTPSGFAALAEANTSSPFAWSLPKANFSFEGTGTPLFGSKSSPSVKADKEKDPLNTSDNAANENDADFVPTAEFKPVIPLPDLINVVTGEENEKIIHEERAKLMRFDLKEWKERGVGNIKILKNEDNGQYRLLMRREQVLKVCCNQRITEAFELKSMKTSDKAWTWYGQDYSEGELKTELFAIKFKNSDLANAFKAAMEKVVEHIKLNPSPVKKSVVSGGPGPDGDKKSNQPSLSEMFKPKPGSWECPGCLVRNNAFITTCPACNTTKPGCQPASPDTKPDSTKPFVAAVPAFTFGMPKSSDSSTAPAPLAIPQFQPSKTVPTTAFTFGIPQATPSTGTSVPTPKPSGKPASFAALLKTPEKSESGKPFSFGSNKFSFSGVKAQSPASPGVGGGGNRTESESEADTTYDEEENDIYFQPVVPLPDKVELTTGEENETIKYQHRAKLYRLSGGEWKERGLGDIKILKHNQNGKFRFIMRREPIEKICLNHYLTSDLVMKVKDDKSWIWSALDFSEGEWVHENFAIRFKTPEIAQEFKKHFDDAIAELGGGTTNNVEQSRSNSASEDEIKVVYVKQVSVSDSERENINKYKLPSNFYDYKNKEPCKGCIGCDNETDDHVIEVSTSSESAGGAGVNTTDDGSTNLSFNKFTVPSSLGVSTAHPFSFSNKITPSNIKQSTPNDSNVNASVISFGSVNSPIVPTSSISSLNSNSYSTPTGNIFNTKLSTNTNTSSDTFGTPSGNWFGSKSTLSVSPQSTTDSPKPALVAPTFGVNMNLFDPNKTTEIKQQQQPQPASLFSGTGAFSFGASAPKPTFGQSTAFGSGNLFGTNTINSGNSFFGAKSSDSQNIFSPVSSATPTTNTTPSMCGTGMTTTNIFGTATQPAFGDKDTNTTKKETKDGVASTPDTAKTNSPSTAPSFLEKVDGAPSFAALASQNTKPAFQQVASNFKWEGAGSALFSSNSPAQKSTTNQNTSKNDDDEDEEGEDGGGGEEDTHDPHFEPIIPLPDIVEVKTGEEEEDILFTERSKLFRFDDDIKEWKERGVGVLKLLFHPVKQTYRLLMRREQVHKVVLNFLLWPEFELVPMSKSDKAWIMTAMNLAEDYPSPELEKLAIRFKNSDLAVKFKNSIDEAVQNVKVIKDNSSTISNQELEEGEVEAVYGSEGEEDEDEEVDVEDEEDPDDDEYVDYSEMSTLLERSTTLLKRPNSQSKWESIGAGTVKIHYDSNVNGYRVQVNLNEDENEICLDTFITADLKFERKGKAIVWTGTDLSLEPAIDQEIMLKFTTSEIVNEFHQTLEEGVGLAEDNNTSNLQEEDD